MNINDFKSYKDIEDFYIDIKSKIMEEYGYLEEDIDVESIEDEVNREASIRFQQSTGFYYEEIDENSFKKSSKKVAKRK